MVCAGMFPVPLFMKVLMPLVVVPVHEKLAPLIFDVSATSVVEVPEQMACVSGELLTRTLGLTVMSTVVVVPEQVRPLKLYEEVMV
jgi:hypothetical protein